jgi:hypothetical protein
VLGRIIIAAPSQCIIGFSTISAAARDGVNPVLVTAGGLLRGFECFVEEFGLVI